MLHRVPAFMWSFEVFLILLTYRALTVTANKKQNQKQKGYFLIVGKGYKITKKINICLESTWICVRTKLKFKHNNTLTFFSSCVQYKISNNSSFYQGEYNS